MFQGAANTLKSKSNNTAETLSHKFEYILLLESLCPLVRDEISAASAIAKASYIVNALCVFEKRGPKMSNFELLFLHGFSSKNREIFHKAVLTPQEYEDYFFGKKLRKK